MQGNWVKSYRVRLADWLISSYRRAPSVWRLQRMLCTRLPNSQRLLTSPSISGESSRDTKNLLLPLEPWQSLMPVLALSLPLSPVLYLSATVMKSFASLLPLWSEQLNKSLITLFLLPSHPRRPFCFPLMPSSLRDDGGGGLTLAMVWISAQTHWDERPALIMA